MLSLQTLGLQGAAREKRQSGSLSSRWDGHILAREPASLLFLATVESTPSAPQEEALVHSTGSHEWKMLPCGSRLLALNSSSFMRAVRLIHDATIPGYLSHHHKLSVLLMLCWHIFLPSYSPTLGSAIWNSESTTSKFLYTLSGC